MDGERESNTEEKECQCLQRPDVNYLADAETELQADRFMSVNGAVRARALQQTVCSSLFMPE